MKEPGKITKDPLRSLFEITEKSWKKLSSKKIYFGHQSVGNNILEGIRQIEKTNCHINLEIMEIGNPGVFNHPVFAHSIIGTNGNPFSKVYAFRDLVLGGIGEKVDFAFFKFCPWDIKMNTICENVFNDYVRSISELEKRYPDVVFVHTTIPLMFYPNGLRAKIKRSLNIPVTLDLDNIKRNDLNKMILQEYGVKEPIFDIALAESTLQDGRRTVFLDHDKTYHYLASEHTDDGGHLNHEGRRRVAEQLLIVLGRLAEKR